MRQALALLSAVLIVGCGAPEVDRAPGPSDDGSAVLASFPSNAPDHFGFGSDASAARVAMWDIDVKPDGEGLPPGSGTVAQGQRVFLTHCVACHGATGTEGPNDRLVGTAAWEQWPNGQTVGNYWPYATTLYDYIRRAMPQLTPGILTSNETYAVVGYILNMNGLVPADAVMDAATLPAVEMPARDRFVLDDREGGPEVR
ncbi:MAG: cytochrome c [Gemmatimonadetes bacterium]|jgi:cytochrome c|nr:cytochrome c [Gemmatimonadota bacterium]HAC06112.1 sulfite oxidase [Gemmatimonadota bacterium]HIN49886.1 cytochrome c [Gemmatimonadota bacterium]